MIIDCVSDLHGNLPKLEGGDLLIIAGDMTARDTIGCWDKFFKWFDAQNYRKKIYIGGNHDNFLTQCCNNKDAADIVYGPEREKQEYLCDSGTEFEGLKIWGSPWTAQFPGINPHCCAFTMKYGPKTEQMLAQKWSLIPRNTDILITHSPPFNFLDSTVEGKMVGSTSLLDWIGQWKPRLHIFGHIHEAYGQQRHFFGKRNWGNPYGVTMINASHVNERYQPVNKPIRIEL